MTQQGPDTAPAVPDRARPPVGAATRFFQVFALVAGAAATTFAVWIGLAAARCLEGLCALGWLLAGVAGVPGVLALLLGTFSLLLRSRPGAAFGLAVTGSGLVALPGAWLVVGLVLRA